MSWSRPGRSRRKPREASTTTTGRRRSTRTSRTASPSSRACGSPTATRLGIRAAARSTIQSASPAGWTSNESLTRSGIRITIRLTCAPTSSTRSTVRPTRGSRCRNFERSRTTARRSRRQSRSRSVSTGRKDGRSASPTRPSSSDTRSPRSTCSRWGSGHSPTALRVRAGNRRAWRSSRPCAMPSSGTTWLASTPTRRQGGRRMSRLGRPSIRAACGRRSALRSRSVIRSGTFLRRARTSLSCSPRFTRD